MLHTQLGEHEFALMHTPKTHSSLSSLSQCVSPSVLAAAWCSFGWAAPPCHKHRGSSKEQAQEDAHTHASTKRKDEHAPSAGCRAFAALTTACVPVTHCNTGKCTRQSLIHEYKAHTPSGAQPHRPGRCHPGHGVHRMPDPVRWTPTAHGGRRCARTPACMRWCVCVLV